MCFGGKQFGGCTCKRCDLAFFGKDSKLRGHTAVGRIYRTRCTEINKLWLKGQRAIREKDVIRTDIPVDNARGMHESDGLENGGENGLCLLLGKRAIRVDVLCKRSSHAFLHDDVDLIDGLKHIHDFNNGKMVETCLGKENLTGNGNRSTTSSRYGLDGDGDRLIGYGGEISTMVIAVPLGGLAQKALVGL